MEQNENINKNFFYQELLIERVPNNFTLSPNFCNSKCWFNSKGIYNSPKGFYPSYISENSFIVYRKNDYISSFKKRPFYIDSIDNTYKFKINDSSFIKITSENKNVRIEKHEQKILL